MADESHGHKTEWFNTVCVLLAYGVILLMLKILSDMVFDHDERLAALEAAWGRKEVPTVVETSESETDNG
jgi:hypothetical protein